MSKKTICIVDRGPMEKISVVVWEHEIPILEEIHGHGSVTKIDTSLLTDGKEALIIKGTNQLVPNDSQNFKVSKNEKGIEEVEIISLAKGEPYIVKKEVIRVPLVPLLEKQLGIGKQFDGDVAAEYGRLETLYGAHHEEKASNVKVVWGRLPEGRFAAMLGGQRQPVEA